MPRYNKYRVMNINPGSKKVKDRTNRIGDGTVVVPHQPLRGRKIFLHLLGYRGADKFESNLKLLGADIEKCFSREVNVLITSQGVSKDYERTKSKSVSPSGTSPSNLSPFNLANLRVVDSPQPDQVGSTLNRKPLTRGQSIVLRATRNSGSGDVIENARRWKIKIIHIDDAQKYVCRELEKIQPRQHEQGLRKKDTKGSLSKPKVKRLQGHYIKFEDASHKYRPVTKFFACFPSLDTSLPPGRCPFDQPKAGCVSLPLELAAERAEHEEHDKNGDDDNSAELKELEQDPDSIRSQAEKIWFRTRHGSKVQYDVGLKMDSKKGSRVSKNAFLSDKYENKQIYTKCELHHMLMDKMKAELKSGYCETCEVKYKDIDKHVKTEQHRQYSRQPANYTSLDKLIQQGPNMEQLLNGVKKHHDLHKALAKRLHSGSEDIQKLDQSSDQRDKCLRSRRSPKIWKHGSVVCSGDDNQKVTKMPTGSASSADCEIPDRAGGVKSDTKDVTWTCPQRGLATPRLAKVAANIMLLTRSNGSWFDYPQKIASSRKDDIVSSRGNLAGSYLGDCINSSNIPPNSQGVTPKKDSCDSKQRGSRDTGCSPAHNEMDTSDTVQTSENGGTVITSSFGIHSYLRGKASPRVYISPLRITEKSQVIETKSSTPKPDRESTLKSKSILKKPGTKSPMKQVLFSEPCCCEQVCTAAELDDLEDGLKPIDWNASDASLDVEHRQDERQKTETCKHVPRRMVNKKTPLKTETVKQSARKVPHRGSPRKVPSRQSPRKVIDIQSPKKEHTKQSPRKVTDIQSLKIEHTKQSPRKVIDIQSPKKEHTKQSPRKVTDIQSPKKEHTKQSPRKVTDIQSLKIEHTKQSPRKVTDIQSPKKEHTKQSPRKVTDIQSLKIEHTKQSPRKVTDIQSPKKEHTKQSPRKVTDIQSLKIEHTKQSPRKVIDIQSPKKEHTKQSPRKVTDVQSSKKELSKQSPRKVTDVQSPKKVHNNQSPRKVTDVQSPKKVHSKQSPRKLIDIHSPRKVHSKQSPRKVTDVQSPKKVHSKQSPRKVTDIQSPKKEHSNHSPRKMTDVQSQKKEHSKQSPRKVKGKQSQQIAQTDKVSCKQLPQRITGKQLPEKAETSSQSVQDVMTTEQSTQGGAHSPDKVVQKRVTGRCSQADVNTSSTMNGKHYRGDSFSQIHCDAYVNNSGQACIISHGLDSDDENNGIQAISDIQEELFLSNSLEVILASDNSTDVQQTAIKLPPINILLPKQLCFVHDSNLNLSSSISVPAVDDWYKSSDLSESWDHQVESFMSQASQSRGPAAAGSLSGSCQTPGMSLPQGDNRQPLQELEVSASGERRDDLVIETKQDVNASDGTRKRCSQSGCDSHLPQKRRFIMKPLHCSTPWKPNDATTDGSRIPADKHLDKKLTRTHSNTHVKQSVKDKPRSESKPIPGGVRCGKKRNCDSADACLMHSEDATEPSGSKKQRISDDSFKISEAKHPKFDYRQLTKRFGTGHHILMISKPDSSRKSNRDCSPTSRDSGTDKSSSRVRGTAVSFSNTSAVPPSSDASKGSGLTLSTGHISSSSPSSVLGVAAVHSLSKRASGAITTAKVAPSSSRIYLMGNQSVDSSPKSRHVVPKITPTKKAALLAAKAKSFMDNAPSGSSRHQPRCKQDVPTRRESSTVKRTK